MSRAEELASLAEGLCRELDAAHSARETALAACRRTIRACSSSVRAVHQLDSERAERFAQQADAELRQAQEAVRSHSIVAAGGPLHDAEKEYAEARLCAALVAGSPLPSADYLAVAVPSWLCGLAEAASELRRHLLDRLREGDLARGEQLLAAMDDVYGLLLTFDYPDALTGGLRRTTDSLRAVLERTRGDLTTTFLQTRLQEALRRRLPPEGE